MSELAFNWLDDERPAGSHALGDRRHRRGRHPSRRRRRIPLRAYTGRDRRRLRSVTVDLAPIDDTVDQPGNRAAARGRGEACRTAATAGGIANRRRSAGRKASRENRRAKAASAATSAGPQQRRHAKPGGAVVADDSVQASPAREALSCGRAAARRRRCRAAGISASTATVMCSNTISPRVPAIPTWTPKCSR